MNNNINKIIFFVLKPFNQRDYSRFGIETLKKYGFEVEVWDFTSVINPKIDVKTPPDQIKDKYFRFNNKKDIAGAMQALKNVFVVNLCHFDRSTLFLYKILSKNNISYCMFEANAIPSATRKKVFNGIFNKLRKITFSQLVNKLILFIPIIFNFNPASFVMAGGEKSLTYTFPITDKTQALWIHALDYDLYLKRGKDLKKESKNALFLDQFYPLHPDLLILGIKPLCTTERYYPALCRFFDIIEKRYGLEIIIAAHPTSNYEKMPDYFGGRKTIRDDTIELVADADFVIMHNSTAINFPILFRKPIIFLTTNELDKTYAGDSIRAFSNMLNKAPLNLDIMEEIDLQRELEIDEEVYQKYIHSFIKKTGTEEQPFWDCFVQKIRQYEW